MKQVRYAEPSVQKVHLALNASRHIEATFELEYRVSARKCETLLIKRLLCGGHLYGSLKY